MTDTDVLVGARDDIVLPAASAVGADLGRHE